MNIEFKEVGKKFGELSALDRVSFQVKQGEFVFITGPCGAGKTTILKIILGRTRPSEGEAIVGEMILPSGKKKPRAKEIIMARRKIGVIFQDFQLIEDCTVEENVGIPLDILHIKGSARSERIEKVLKKVALLSKKDFFPAQLSGGELQRVCLARALAVEPEVILADEPTGNLDPETGWKLVELLDKINKGGTTVIMATHNFDIVNSMQKRVIKVVDGKIVADKKKGKYDN